LTTTTTAAAATEEEEDGGEEGGGRRRKIKMKIKMRMKMITSYHGDEQTAISGNDDDVSINITPAQAGDQAPAHPPRRARKNAMSGDAS
jgi:hypothetical protein